MYFKCNLSGYKTNLIDGKLDHEWNLRDDDDTQGRIFNFFDTEMYV